MTPSHSPLVDATLSVLGVFWHRVTPILGASVLLAWGITRCVNLFLVR